MGPWQGWLTIPAAFLIGWVFNAMDRIGEATENPFEGNANDTPITTLSRTIEIDLRELLGEANIPSPLAAQDNIQI
jgi:putative membrane protein